MFCSVLMASVRFFRKLIARSVQFCCDSPGDTVLGLPGAAVALASWLSVAF
jgi:hypothetical protein